jgi:hypothetical protein
MGPRLVTTAIQNAHCISVRFLVRFLVDIDLTSLRGESAAAFRRGCCSALVEGLVQVSFLHGLSHSSKVCCLQWGEQAIGTSPKSRAKYAAARLLWDYTGLVNQKTTYAAKK